MGTAYSLAPSGIPRGEPMRTDLIRCDHCGATIAGPDHKPYSFLVVDMPNSVIINDQEWALVRDSLPMHFCDKACLRKWANDEW